MLAGGRSQINGDRVGGGERGLDQIAAVGAQRDQRVGSARTVGRHRAGGAKVRVFDAQQRVDLYVTVVNQITGRVNKAAIAIDLQRVVSTLAIDHQVLGRRDRDRDGLGTGDDRAVAG